MKILISNDDGVFAPGLKVLADALKKIGRVYVVAPMEEKSTMGHSLTLHKPLRVHEVAHGFYGINGSPADCVYIAIREVMKGSPDIVISGPNRGGNLGQDVYYSGTVSAAREACILGIPAIALSVDVLHGSKKPLKVRYDTAASAVRAFLKGMDLKDFPKHTLFNINVPNVSAARLKGQKYTRMGFRYYSGNVVRRVDHRGRPYFWVGGQYKGYHNEKGTDCEAVNSGYVSVTPLQLDCTNHKYLKAALDL
jgi:5'-nucleotidase